MRRTVDTSTKRLQAERTIRLDRQLRDSVYCRPGRATPTGPVELSPSMSGMARGIFHGLHGDASRGKLRSLWALIDQLEHRRVCAKLRELMTAFNEAFHYTRITPRNHLGQDAILRAGAGDIARGASTANINADISPSRDALHCTVLPDIQDFRGTTNTRRFR